jgi:acyl carrier protein
VSEQDRIRAFIREDILFGATDVSLDDDAPLLDGVLDSMALMRLVAFLEEEFDVELADEDITVENFKTVGNIARVVKASGGSASKDREKGAG